MPRLYYDSEDEAERDLDAYMNHYHGKDSSAAFNFGPPVSVDYSHPWPLSRPLDNGGDSGRMRE